MHDPATVAQLLTLAARVEQADGPSRGLDAEIAAALRIVPDFDPSIYIVSISYMPDERRGVGFVAAYMDHADGPLCVHSRPAPHYTGSVDAVLTLVPEGWWLNIEAGTQKRAPSWEWPVIAIGDQETGDTLWRGQARTLPLALCAAALRARAAEGEA